MNKKWYWALGVLVIVIVAVFIWAAKPAGTTPQSPAGGTDAADNAQTDHTGHGQSDTTDDANLRSYLEDQETIMTTMMDEMKNIERSESADIDFLSGMIPHHASAVSMAQSYLKYGGENETLATLAQDIITTQTQEIEQMRGMIETIKTTGNVDSEKSKAYLEAYEKMMDHSMSHAAADNIDAAFADGMIVHHQMAIDMANAILPNTDDESVKKLYFSDPISGSTGEPCSPLRIGTALWR